MIKFRTAYIKKKIIRMINILTIKSKEVKKSKSKTIQRYIKTNNWLMILKKLESSKLKPIIWKIKSNLL